MTSTGDFIPQIDSLRLVALLLVLGHHVFAQYLVHTHRLGTQELPRDWDLIYPRSPLVSWALDLAVGIPMFCLISGFVLSLPFLRAYSRGQPGPSIRLYLLRRLIRMEPPYVISMLFFFGAIVIPWGEPNPQGYFFAYFDAFFPHLLASLAYAHAAVYGTASWINGVAWTLEIEVQFYLLLPLVAQLLRIRHTQTRRSILAGLILISALIAQFYVVPSGSPRLNLSLLVQLQYFLAGLLLADLHLTGFSSPLSPRVADLLAVCAVAALVIVRHWFPQFLALEPFVLAGLNYGVIYGSLTSRMFGLPFLTALGGMAYTVYLYHFFIIDWLLPYSVRLFPPAHSLAWDVGLQLLLLLPPVFGLCSVLFLLTEKPFMQLSRSIANRARARR